MARKQSITSEMIDKQLDDNFLDRVNEDDDSAIVGGSNYHVTQGTPLQLRSPDRSDASNKKEAVATTEKVGPRKPINLYTNPANGPMTLKVEGRHQIGGSGASSDCDGASETSSCKLIGGDGSNNSYVKESSSKTEMDKKLEPRSESGEENGNIKSLDAVSLNDKNTNEGNSVNPPNRSEAEGGSELDTNGDSNISCLLDDKEKTGAS